MTAGRADLEIRLDTGMAVIAGLALSHLGQKGLLFKLALVNLRERLTWPEDHIDEQPADEENGD